MAVKVWPRKLLTPQRVLPNPTPFSRSGGRTLGGIRRAVRTDRGFWSITYETITLHSVEQRRTWNAIRSHLAGSAGLIEIPVWAFDSAPFADGVVNRNSDILTSHSDGAPFSDGSLYQQPSILIRMHLTAPLGSTVVSLRKVHAWDDLAGIRFGYAGAMYETGPALSIDGDVWRVPIFPAIRQAIPADTELECDYPTVICRLADDRGMDVGLDASMIDEVSVSFLEAVDYFDDLAEAA